MLWESIRQFTPLEMPAPLILVVLCFASAALAAPQAVSRPVSAALLQPQILPPAAYVQPQVLRTAYPRPQLVQSLPYARRVALPYAQPTPGVILAAEPTAAVPLDAVRPAPVSAVRTAPIAPAIVRQGLVSGVARPIAILRQSQDIGVDGSYNFGFESEDGIAVETNAGPLTPVGPEEGVQTVTGSFSYTAPDGTPITTTWIADENGYRAEGAHLPRGPLNL